MRGFAGSEGSLEDRTGGKNLGWGSGRSHRKKRDNTCKKGHASFSGNVWGGAQHKKAKGSQMLTPSNNGRGKLGVTPQQ